MLPNVFLSQPYSCLNVDIFISFIQKILDAYKYTIFINMMRKILVEKNVHSLKKYLKLLHLELRNVFKCRDERKFSKNFTGFKESLFESLKKPIIKF